ncbi:hypothetical protein [Agromyces sp. NPDC056965]|uniref:hypothetical protein n=1 Tax=Agromyces sp. NPDC056965 TaxID=3345983 RepID=UPI003640BFFB
MNSYYWGAASSIAAVHGVLRHLSDEDNFRSKLGLNQKRFDRALNHTTSKYEAEVKVSDAWHRLAALVILLSAFERYMAAVTSLAVASDPSLTPGFPKVVEGLALRKHNVRLAEHDLVNVVKGDWSSRAAAYARLFGENTHVSNAIGELDAMRRARNQIAHEFATVERQPIGPHAALLVGARQTAAAFNDVSVSEKRLLNWFDVVRGVVRRVDEQLLRDFIGNYEVPALYLEWAADPVGFESASGVSASLGRYSKERNAKRFLGLAMNKPRLSMAYVRSVITFCNAL